MGRRIDGQRVRAWRIRQRLTQAQAAAMCGVAERSWRRWETGERHPPDMLLHFMRLWENHDKRVVKTRPHQRPKLLDAPPDPDKEGPSHD